MDLAAPVDVSRRREEPQGRRVRLRLSLPVLCCHKRFDPRAQLHPALGLGLSGPQDRALRFPLGHLDGAPVVADRDKHHAAFERVLDAAATRVAGGDIDDDRHARAAREHNLGRDLDQVAHSDRPVEVDIADVCRDAVAPRPARRAGKPGLVDPLEDPAATH